LLDREQAVRLFATMWRLARAGTAPLEDAHLPGADEIVAALRRARR
jgi:hypothetical protein